MLVDLSIMISVIIGLIVLMRLWIVKISKSQNFLRLGWMPLMVMSISWPLFIVLAQIQAAETEKQNVFANENLIGTQEAQA